MIPRGPLAPLVLLFDAGCVLVTCIALCAVLAAIVTDVRALFRRGRRPSALQRQLAIEDLDIAAGRAARRQQGNLGSLVQPPRPLDPDPALGCRFCGPPFAVDAVCTCASACPDPNCGWNVWPAVSNTEGWER